MPHIFIKSARIAIWVSLPFLFTSYVSPDKLLKSETALFEGSYNLNTSGSENLELTGTIDFVTTVEFYGQRYPFLYTKAKSEESPKWQHDIL